MTKAKHQKAVEITRKYFLALKKTGAIAHTVKGVHELGSFETGVLTSIGIQRIQNDPDDLIKDARRSVEAFDALRFAAGQHLALGITLPTPISQWVAAYLQGKLKRPLGKEGKPSAEGMHRAIYGAVVRLIEMGLTATRNPASPPLSACDVVAEVLRDLELSPTTYGTVKDIYLDIKQGKTRGSYPPQFLISRGRVVDTS